MCTRTPSQPFRVALQCPVCSERLSLFLSTPETLTAAAIMRIGLIETKNFCQEFFTDVLPETFLEESAGVADLITSCLGGRNRKTAEAFVQTGKPFDELEREMLGGQSE